MKNPKGWNDDIKMKITKRQLRRIIREQFAERGQADDAVKLGDTVRDLVKDGTSLYDLPSELQKWGFKGAYNTSSFSGAMVVVPNVNGKKYVIISAKKAEDPEMVIGPYAIGPIE
jgi:hypothetical protein